VRGHNQKLRFALAVSLKVPIVTIEVQASIDAATPPPVGQVERDAAMAVNKEQFVEHIKFHLNEVVP
jgi:hypothetical protein